MIFTDVLEQFARITMLKCLGSSIPNIFQAVSLPPDPVCVTQGSRKIPGFFVPPDPCLIFQNDRKELSLLSQLLVLNLEIIT